MLTSRNATSAKGSCNQYAKGPSHPRSDANTHDDNVTTRRSCSAGTQIAGLHQQSCIEALFYISSASKQRARDLHLNDSCLHQSVSISSNQGCLDALHANQDAYSLADHDGLHGGRRIILQMLIETMKGTDIRDKPTRQSNVAPRRRASSTAHSTYFVLEVQGKAKRNYQQNVSARAHSQPRSLSSATRLTPLTSPMPVEHKVNAGYSQTPIT